MLGIQVLMTDDPENTKAVLSTKVSVRGSRLELDLRLLVSLPTSGKGRPFTESGVI